MMLIIFRGVCIWKEKGQIFLGFFNNPKSWNKTKMLKQPKFFNGGSCGFPFSDYWYLLVIFGILIKDQHFMIRILFIHSGVTFASFFVLIFSNFNNFTVPYHAECPLYGHDWIQRGKLLPFYENTYLLYLPYIIFSYTYLLDWNFSWEFMFEIKHYGIVWSM